MDNGKITNKTVEVIEKALGDLKDNKASKQEVLDLIDERKAKDVEAIEAAKKEVADVKSQADELKTLADNLQKQVRQLKAAEGYSPDGKGRYNGIYSSPVDAKLVGLAIMAASMTAGMGRVDVARKRTAILKALDRMGAEVNWLDDNGKKTATTTSQASGSALVTIEQAPGLILLLEQYGVYRRNAMPVPMGAGQTPTPKIDQLLTVYVPGEGTAPTLTDPEAKCLMLTPKVMTALSAYSLELDEDSAIPLAELYGQLFARSFAYYEDLCGFLGDGTSTYFGFTGIVGALRAVDSTIGNIKSLVVGAGNAYSELTLANFEAVAGTLPTGADDENAKWFVHKYFYYTVMVPLAIAAGGTPMSEILLGMQRRQRLYLGYDVEFTQVMPKAEANSQICALLANLRLGAMLGTRGGMEFAQSDQRYFDQGLVALRGRNRVAINAHGVGDTTDAGPICGLITAAS